jgi:hypothetical protein
MNCPEVRAHLPGLLYDDLNPDEVAAVEHHLTTCPACRRERDALERVRQALAAVPAPAVQIDLPRLYRQAAELHARRARRWRRAALTLGAVAALLLFAVLLRLRVGLEGRRLVVSWGEVPPAPLRAAGREREDPAPPVRIVGRKPRSARNLEARLVVVNQLVHALAADVEGRDDQQQQQLDRLRVQLEGLRRTLDRRWTETERSVSALYAAQFRLPKKGDSE